MPLSIKIYVLCNSLAIEINETYDDMIGLRLLLYMCKAESHIYVKELKLRGYEFNSRTVADILQKLGTNSC